MSILVTHTSVIDNNFSVLVKIRGLRERNTLKETNANKSFFNFANTHNTTNRKVARMTADINSSRGKFTKSDCCDATFL